MGKIEDIMKVVYKKRKDGHLDTMEKYYIYKKTKKEHKLMTKTR
jgi:hypothetical protein